MLITLLATIPSSLTFSESVGPVGTPGLVPLAIGLLMLFIFGWAIVQRSWQTTIYEQENAEQDTHESDH